MTRTLLSAIFLLAAWPAAAAWAPVPPTLTVRGPEIVQPLQPATFTLPGLPVGDFSAEWHSPSHSTLKYGGGPLAQTYSWDTTGQKIVLVHVLDSHGFPFGFGEAYVQVQGPDWTGHARAWPPWLYFAVGRTIPVATQWFDVIWYGPPGPIPWTLKEDWPWLTNAPDQGTGTATVKQTVDATGLDVGIYDAASELDSPWWQDSVTTTLKVRSTDLDEPFGELSTPPYGATVQGSVPVTGWALDDAGVDTVSIYACTGVGNVPIDTMPQVNYLGEATLVDGARPDAAAAYYDFPRSTRSGWGYVLLTNLLPGGGNGTYSLYVQVKDLWGNTRLLGPRPIVVDNANAVKPFGAIDTPAPGATASGTAYANTGWVLTPSPNWVPFDGSTIEVYVDGVKRGNAAYSYHRSDISTLFPGYANSNAPGAIFYLDTTVYRDGLHTIQWTATDNLGNTEGIGSRYFNISNSDSGSSSAPSERPRAPLPVRARAADGTPPPRTITVADPAKDIVTLAVADYLPPGDGTFTGYEVHGDLFGPLPVGTTLATETGAFAWQPGPAFGGTVVLEFWRTSAAGVIDSARIQFELGDAPHVTRKLHRARRALGRAGP